MGKCHPDLGSNICPCPIQRKKDLSESSSTIYLTIYHERCTSKHVLAKIHKVAFHLQHWENVLYQKWIVYVVIIIITSPILYCDLVQWNQLLPFSIHPIIELKCQSINQSLWEEGNSLSTSDITVATVEPLLALVSSYILPTQDAGGRGNMGQWDSFQGISPALLICRCCDHALDGRGWGVWVHPSEQLFYFSSSYQLMHYTNSPLGVTNTVVIDIFMISSSLHFVALALIKTQCLYTYKESSSCVSASTVMW